MAYGERVVLNTQPMQNWLNRLGEGLYNHETPDGYPLTRTDWASPGQLATRFEIARGIAYRVPGRYWAEPLGPLSPGTREALAQASSLQESNLLLLSSPEFMNR